MRILDFLHLPAFVRQPVQILVSLGFFPLHRQRAGTVIGTTFLHPVANSHIGATDPQFFLGLDGANIMCCIDTIQWNLGEYMCEDVDRTRFLVA